MNETRARKLIDAYGGAPARWPVEVRDTLRRLCEQTPVLEAYRQAALATDRALDAYVSTTTLDPTEIVARITEAAAVPQAARAGEDTVERLLQWLFPAALGGWWRPALAAAMPLAVGVWLGTATPPAITGVDWHATEQALFLPVDPAAVAAGDNRSGAEA